MLPELKATLEQAGALTNNLPPIINRIVDSIPINVPLRFKQTIAVSEIMLYASHLRRNIAHWDGGSIPVNSISFVIAGSGIGKDSGVNYARKCFSAGYQLINEKRLEIAVQQAVKLASLDGCDQPYLHENYSKYYVEPDELFAAPDSSIKGLHKHFNALEASGIGGGFVYSG